VDTADTDDGDDDDVRLLLMLLDDPFVFCVWCLLALFAVHSGPIMLH
jgi:hypothetical protein